MPWKTRTDEKLEEGTRIRLGGAVGTVIKIEKHPEDGWLQGAPDGARYRVLWIAFPDMSYAKYADRWTATDNMPLLGFPLLEVWVDEPSISLAAAEKIIAMMGLICDGSDPWNAFKEGIYSMVLEKGPDGQDYCLKRKIESMIGKGE